MLGWLPFMVRLWGGGGGFTVLLQWHQPLFTGFFWAAFRPETVFSVLLSGGGGGGGPASPLQCFQPLFIMSCFCFLYHCVFGELPWLQLLWRGEPGRPVEHHQPIFMFCFYFL